MAEAILRANKKQSGLDSNGFIPSYRFLSSYAHLVDASKNKDKHIVKGGINETIKVIRSVTLNNFHQVTSLSNHLKAETLEQSCFNIWHWLKTNIKYDFDPIGIEAVRTPARTFADRHHQADCEDLSIFAAALLINMGYTPQFKIVAFNGSKEWQHIYTVCGNMVIDAVLDVFNQEPKGISKEMNINILSGLNNKQLGAPDSKLTQLLLDKQSELLELRRTGGNNKGIERALRKIRYLISLQGTDIQAEMTVLFQHVADFDPKTRQIIFVNEQQQKDFYQQAAVIQQKNSAQNQRILNTILATGDIAPDELEREHELGLGGLFDKIAAAVVRVVGEVGKVFANDRGDERIDAWRRRTVDNIDEFTNKFNKFNPTKVAMRGAFLALVRLNFRNFAGRLKILSSSELSRQHKISENERVKKFTRVKEIWEDFGGNMSKLMDAINAGHNKKAIFGSKGISGTQQSQQAQDAEPLANRVEDLLADLPTEKEVQGREKIEMQRRIEEDARREQNRRIEIRDAFYALLRLNYMGWSNQLYALMNKQQQQRYGITDSKRNQVVNALNDLLTHYYSSFSALNPHVVEGKNKEAYMPSSSDNNYSTRDGVSGLGAEPVSTTITGLITASAKLLTGVGLVLGSIAVLKDKEGGNSSNPIVVENPNNGSSTENNSGTSDSLESNTILGMSPTNALLTTAAIGLLVVGIKNKDKNKKGKTKKR